MREAPNVLGIVMAGGEGKRLYPLTADRAKPAVPFGGAYRLIDFVLSNLDQFEAYCSVAFERAPGAAQLLRWLAANGRGRPSGERR